MRSCSRFCFRFVIFFWSLRGSSSKSTRSFGSSSSLFCFFASIFSYYFLAFFSRRALISASISSLVLRGLFDRPSPLLALYFKDLSRILAFAGSSLAFFCSSTGSEPAPSNVPPPPPKSKKNPPSFYSSSAGRACEGLSSAIVVNFYSSLFLRLVLMIFYQLLVATWINCFGFLLVPFAAALATVSFSAYSS